jgi:hypothetical protein
MAQLSFTWDIQNHNCRSKSTLVTADMSEFAQMRACDTLELSFAVRPLPSPFHPLRNNFLVFLDFSQWCSGKLLIWIERYPYQVTIVKG